MPLYFFGLKAPQRLKERVQDRHAGRRKASHPKELASDGETMVNCRRTSLLKLRKARHRMGLHGKGGRSKKMKSSEGSDKREVAEA